MLQNLPRIFGNTDPLQFLRLLPGVQTNSDCDAGVHIHGCDNAHNDISIDGVPIYGASHLLGIFSVFNPSHYSKMFFSESSTSNRLGGTVTMTFPDTLNETVSGDISVGLMSSQGSLAFRLGKKSHMRLSARRSYLNLLYGRWLMLGYSQMKYGFGDYNISYVYTPTGNDKVWLDLYCGNDKVLLDEQSFNMKLSVDWGNLAAGVNWEHKGSSSIHRHTLFFSGYGSDVNVVQDGASVRLPSYIMSAGYKGLFRWQGLRAGADVIMYESLPQYPHVEGLFDLEGAVPDVQLGLETSVYAGYHRSIVDALDLDASVRGSVFLVPDAGPQYVVSPDIRLSYDFYNWGKVRATYGWRTQYLFQTGLSNIGLPLEFWILSGRYSKPQRSQSADLSYELGIFNGGAVFSAGVYCKALYNQMEYKGDVLDLFLTEYELADKFLKGRGLNYGVNVMLQKQSGKLTGWVNYSLGRAIRGFDNPEYSGIYPANHERIHNLNLVSVYQMDRWNFSGTFVYASGLPFTAPRSFYISSGQILAIYGEHNACRMRPYIRADLSVTYSFTKKDDMENGINLSIYNVLGRKNDIMYKVGMDEEGYYFSAASIPMRFLPSLSYYHKF